MSKNGELKKDIMYFHSQFMRHSARGNRSVAKSYAESVIYWSVFYVLTEHCDVDKLVYKNGKWEFLLRT